MGSTTGVSARLKRLVFATKLNSNRKPLFESIINLSPPSHQCRDFKELKQKLSQMICAGFIKNKFDAKTLVKFSTDIPSIHVDYSFQIFNVIENPDASIYNILMKAYVERNYPHRAIHLYRLMLYRCVSSNVYTYPFLVGACATRLSQFEGQQVHNHVLKSGFDSDVHVRSTFVDMYADCWNTIDARKIFDEGPMMDSFVWYALLDRYIITREAEEAENIYNMMPQKDIISLILLIFMFKVEYMEEKFKQFINEIPKNDTVFWSLLIYIYVRHERYEEAIDLFRKLHANGITVDEFVVEAVLCSCANAVYPFEVVDMGNLTHGLVMKLGIESDVEVENRLICMYSNSEFEDIQSAQQMFFNATCLLDVSTWNAMIEYYGERNLVEKVRAFCESMPERSWSWFWMIYYNDCFSESLALFQEMRSEFELDTHSFESIIECMATRFGALDLGKCIHAHLLKSGCHLNDESGCGYRLSRMYTACGYKTGVEGFHSFPEKEKVNWPFYFPYGWP